MRIFFLIFILLSSHAYTAERKVVKDEPIPNWFKTTFMDFSEDLEEANENNRHIMIYFHQNGCPYCAKLVRDNFHDKPLVEKLKKNFDSIEVNMFGNRDLNDWMGREFSEKEFAVQMKIQFTPTLVFLNAKGKTLLRLNGYQSIKKMHATLGYISNKIYLKKSYVSYLSDLKKNKTGVLNANVHFESGPHLLMRNQTIPAQKVLAVFFEEPNCEECNNFHKNIMPLKQTQEYLKQMQVVRFNAFSDEKLITPTGKRTTAKDWYESLNLTYAPAVVFFDQYGKEIIRKDAFLKQFHWLSILEYVASADYKHQPEFQRYIIERGDRLRAQGVEVDIWK
ncbi:thioredoxin family protein [Bathymodiolus septemdierum thioautotrophic gill symbiont]|uniref:Thioredoxin n=1 Tax=endosymbiont of Bathymodiolus septemdierum str. Myojin knoll TaxID=1303921 RepID=A0A0P0URB9_9GAMM|nr:thioredoxin fold domain-containing protein [Bathymodiolus septemdierum thioautotrophic gill symbiont]BAS67786.1 thioredoxin [endosymbiont of Bathymodiolus septemdierum str. Myojin knoll]